jgi:hypothetical protein
MKSLIAGGIVAASLAMTGTAATAAAAQVHKNPRAAHVIHKLPARHVFAHKGPRYVRPEGLAQFLQFFFGGRWPEHYAGRVQVSRGAAPSYDYSPSSDNSPAIDDGSAARQAAADAENAAIQQMNDTNAMVQSMQAAEQQNDAANAASLQTEINAGF